MEIVYRKLDDLIPNPKNPRKAPDGAIKKLAESIKANPKFFEARPILLSDRLGYLMIIGGERRSEAARLLGMTEVPSILIPGLSEEQEDEIMIRDNTHSGVWDDAKLQSWTKDQLQSWNVDGVKWPKEQLKTTEDEFEEKKIIQRCGLGDIWQLGNHRLMCGDSTDVEQVAILMNGDKARMTLTDPPYRLMTEGGGILKTANSMKQIHENKVDSFEPLKLKIYSDTNIYTHNKPLIKEYILLAERENLPYDLAIYKKPGLPNYKGHLMTDIEYIAIIGNQDPKKGYDLEMYSKVFFGGKDSENELSYSKPIKLCEKFICLYSDEGESVLDLFGGSGTTLIACEQLNRKCYMMELDPYYCDVIISRWEQFTGKNAIKL